MKRYTQLAQEERYQIHALLRAGTTQRTIAAMLDRHPSTISRELRRNSGGRGYRPKQAQRFARKRQKSKSRCRISSGLWVTVKDLLSQQWSPEQISGWLKTNHGIRISHEWIYQFVYRDKRRGGSLHQHLRCQKARRKRYGSYTRRGHILGIVRIDQRPAIVDTRCRIGDWEADTMVGQYRRQALVTLAERKSRLALLQKVPNSSGGAVAEAMLELLKPVASHVHTITSDNGKEFAQHQRIATELDAQFYFAHPYASWERGLNENTNGLIRQYIPKRTDLSEVSDQQVQQVMDKLNNRPRKCLGYKTPNEVFFGIKPDVALTT